MLLPGELEDNFGRRSPIVEQSLGTLVERGRGKEVVLKHRVQAVRIAPKDNLPGRAFFAAGIQQISERPSH
ncbi:MAG: hypothetical protein ACYSR4_04265 [Planctomycetota bacterium]|jgi:hypothetical protein